jgi:hypothetical protein
MTIHWKAPDEQFLIVPLVFVSTIFGRKINFLDISQNTSVLKVLKRPTPKFPLRIKRDVSYAKLVDINKNCDI